jgi:formylglycine-generating enzyme required for sulfatase activity
MGEFLIDEKRGLSERGLIASLYGLFASGEGEGYARLEELLTRSAVGPDASAASKLALQKQQASAAIALLISDRPEKIWPLLRHTPDPTVRTLLIDRMAPSGVEARVLWDRLENEADVSARRALLQSLGEYGLDRLPGPERAKLSPRLKSLYREDPDAGVHGSAGYLLRKWGMGKEVLAMDQELQKSKPVAGRKWYVNGQGQTMAMITKPGPFWMGEGQELRRRRIERSYAISSTEVTVEQFQRFLKDRPQKDIQYDQELSPTSDSPMNNVRWYEAAAYCNWLSEKEGISKDQWCYVPNKEGKYAEGMGMKKDFVNLTGYRLPTEAEWENACRSGSDTTYTYGESDEQLGNYAWYDITTKSAKSYPVGGLRPNEHGLFDMHGNMWEWCQDRYNLSPAISWKGSSIPDSQDDQATIGQEGERRVLRGGSFANPASVARSASRYGNGPGKRLFINGFRPARTFIP